MTKKFQAYLRLMRPANIITAFADILAGIAVSGYLQTDNRYHYIPLILLLISTFGLYGGGVVLNDVFDAELDKAERSERPIPSGVIPVGKAASLGFALLILGVAAALLLYPACGIIAVCIALAAIIYDKYGKHHSFFGPLNMGLCRGLNLLLGVSIVPQALPQWWWLAFIPIIYIAAITLISRGEVHGGNRPALLLGMAAYLIVLLSIFGLLYFKHSFNWWNGLLLLIFAFAIYQPLARAYQNLSAPLIGKAVKAGVIFLIFMDASLAAAFASSVAYILLIVLLLPVSLLLAKVFSVT